MLPFVERRRRVLERIPAAVAVIPSAPVAVRNNDVEHEYRQDSDLYYLTGFAEPEAVLVLSTVHPEHRAVLFLRPRDPEREVWDGARLGVEGAVAELGVDAAFPIGELAQRLPDYLSGAKDLYYELGRCRRTDQRVQAAITHARGRGRNPKPWPKRILHPELCWHELRLFKEPAELEHMRRAAAITEEAHLGVMRLAGPGKHEYELDALLREVFMRHGAERPAYPPIVGSGPNATVLHYRAGRRRIEADELVLVDAGCEYEYYAADVTRTFPASGRFTTPQRRVYEVVLEAQLACIAETKPGANIERIHQKSVRTLTEGMVRIGLLAGSVDELIQNEGYKRYYMHRTSHWLGMDVHDVGAYFLDGEPRPLAPGMVLTIEPGIYVSAADDQAPPELRGIGVRIEDDVLVRESGAEVLTAAIPKSVEDVERACRG